VEATKARVAEDYVRLHGLNPNSEDGQRRVKAILTSAEYCETWAQFTRAAGYAVSPEFGTVVYDADFIPVDSPKRSSLLTA
jgi:hypothetical protein